MKRYIQIALLLGVTLLQAQVKDSLQSGHSVENHIFFQQLSGDLSIVPANYSFYHIDDYTASSLSYEYEDGPYRQGGEPETVKQFGIRTNGLYRNEKGLTFFGYFSVAKSYYDNLKWNLSYGLPVEGLMPDPHYFLVSKGAKWNNQNYDLGGGVLVPLSKKFELMFKIDYNLFNKYRTDYDPRPKITNNSLGFTSGITYQITNRHFIKLGGGMGYSHIDNGIDFSNNNQNIPGNYDIYVRWMSGYGSLSNTATSSTARRNKWTMLYVGHAYKTRAWILLTDLMYRKDKNITYVSSEIKDYDNTSNYFAKYAPETVSGTVLSILDLPGNKFLKFKLSGSTMSANNLWYSKGGKTYVAERNEIGLEIGYLKQLDRGAGLDAGVFLTYWDLNQHDALSTTYSGYSNLEIGGHIMRSIQVDKSVLISPIFKTRLRFTTDAEFIQGNADYLDNIDANDFAGLTLQGFYNEVVLPDHEMFSKNELDISIGTQLNFKASERINTQFSLEFGLKKPLEELQYFQAEHPTRYYGMAGLTLYY